MRKRALIALVGIAAAVVAFHAGSAVSAETTSTASTSTVVPAQQAAPAVTTAARSAPASPSAASARTYDLDFTLPTYGKSGCLVCHGDPNLARVGFETTTSVYVDVVELEESAHKNEQPCTGCHLDFAYTSPHEQTEVTPEWQVAAKSACKNCHSEQFSDYANGAHSPAGEPGVTPTATVEARAAAGKPKFVPLCGDCHGGHSIPASGNVEAQAALRLSGVQMCGNEDCHLEAALSYRDYYHGAAYQRGAPDSPSCWDCHGYHQIIPSYQRNSPVHPSRLAETCGQDGCHAGAEIDSEFLDYAQLIHGQAAIKAANPVGSRVSGLRSAIGSALDTVLSWF